LLFAPDKRVTIDEFARVLRPGGRLVATTWDYHSQPEGRPPRVADHRPLLTAAGFRTRAYAETEAWRERITGITDRLLEAVRDLAVETGADPNELRDDLHEMAATTACMIRRVMLIAVRG
jgi:SAM-dependent methyltransferase